MPLLHCSNCHHEYECYDENWKRDLCDWCGATPYKLKDKTELELMCDVIEERGFENIFGWQGSVFGGGSVKSSKEVAYETASKKRRMFHQLKEDLEKLIKDWEAAADRWADLGKTVVDWESKNEFYAHEATFKTCANSLKEVLMKKLL